MYIPAHLHTFTSRLIFPPFRRCFVFNSAQVGGIELKLEGSRIGVDLALETSAADGLPETARCERCDLALGFPSDWIRLTGDGSNDLLLAILQAVLTPFREQLYS